MIRRELGLLRAAVELLTRLPVPAARDYDPSLADRSARYFPLVGALVGMLSAGVLLGAGLLWPAWIAAALAVLFGVAVTGAMHEDGLADTVDGLGGGRTHEQRLEIMKDSRVGSYGALALVAAVVLKTGALAALDPLTGAGALVAAHAAARLAPLAVMRAFPYAGRIDLSRLGPLRKGLDPAELAIAGGVALAVPLLALSTMTALAGLAAAVVLAALAALWIGERIGGYTGDTLGAVEQVAEIAFLLAVAAMARA